MTPDANHYVRSHVLKLNVGFLLNDGPGHSHETTFDVPAVRVADDLHLDYLRGPLRLSRTKEGILIQGQLHAGLQGECRRCLTPVPLDLIINLEELFAYPVSGQAEFGIGEDGILDLAPLLRAETLILASQDVLCRPDCKGLCLECGANRNEESCTCDDASIDPRLAKLKELLDRN